MLLDPIKGHITLLYVLYDLQHSNLCHFVTIPKTRQNRCKMFLPAPPTSLWTFYSTPNSSCVFFMTSKRTRLMLMSASERRLSFSATYNVHGVWRISNNIAHYNAHTQRRLPWVVTMAITRPLHPRNSNGGFFKQIIHELEHTVLYHSQVVFFACFVLEGSLPVWGDWTWYCGQKNQCGISPDCWDSVPEFLRSSLSNSPLSLSAYWPRPGSADQRSVPGSPWCKTWSPLT